MGWANKETGNDAFIIPERVRDVGTKESDVDDLEWKLTRNALASRLRSTQKLHLQHWLEKITTISYTVKDAFDCLNSLIFKPQI